MFKGMHPNGDEDGPRWSFDQGSLDWTDID